MPNIGLERSIVVLIGLLIVANYISRTVFYIDTLLIFIATIFILYREKVPVTALLKYRFPFILGCSYLILFVINIVNPTDYYGTNIAIILYLFLFFTFYYYFSISEFSKQNIVLFLKVLFFSVFTISLILITSMLFNIDFLYLITKLKFIEFNSGHYHVSQTFIAITIGFLLYYVNENKSLFLKFALAIIIISIFISQGKTAILVLLFGVITFYITSSKSISPLKIMMTLVLFFTTLSFIYFLRISEFSELTLNTITTGRYEGWVLYIKSVLEYNTLFGHGMFGSSIFYEKGLLLFKHPHNIFIEVFFTTGLLGFFVLVGLFVLYAKVISALEVSLSQRALLLTTFISVLLSGQAFWSIWSKNHVIPIFTLVAVSFLISQSKKIKNLAEES